MPIEVRSRVIYKFSCASRNNACLHRRDYEGSSPPKSCFKFCYVEPVWFKFFAEILEQKLNKRNRI